MTYIAIIVLSFVEYLLKMADKRSKHAGRLPHVRVLFYLYIYIYDEM